MNEHRETMRPQAPIVEEDQATHRSRYFRLSEANSTPLGTRRAFPNAPSGTQPDNHSTPAHGPNTSCPPSVAQRGNHDQGSDEQSVLARDAIAFQNRLHFQKRMEEQKAADMAAFEKKFKEMISPNGYKDMTHVDPTKVFNTWGGSGPGALIDPSNPEATNIYCESPFREGPGNFSALIDLSQEGVLGLAKFLLEQGTVVNKNLTAAEIRINLVTEAQHSEQKQALTTAAEHVAQQLQCANCLSSIHRMRDCSKPDHKYGCILGCPLCNTKEHTLDECPILKEWYAPGTKQTRFTQEGIHSFIDLILERENKPWFVSRLDPLDILGKVWASSPQFRPCLTPGKYPWTNDFSKRMAKIQTGDPALEGKLHWCDWSTRTSKAEDLPVDPIFQDKKGQLLDPETVFQMVESKVIPNQSTKNPKSNRDS